MDSFFILGDELDVDSRNDQGTAHSEPLKDQGEDIIVDNSVETPTTKDVRTPIKPGKLDEFTAQLIAVKAFFINEVFELKNKIARLKEPSLNGRSNFSEENFNAENLKYQISLLQSENTPLLKSS